MLTLLADFPKESFVEGGKTVALHLEKTYRNNPLFLKGKVAIFSQLKNEISTFFLRKEFDKWGVDFDVISQSPKEAFDATSYNVIFLPGLAFDKNGGRLGRGGGFFDRALANKNNYRDDFPTLIALALDEQLVHIVPTDGHDILMDYICTPSLGLLSLRGNNE